VLEVEDGIARLRRVVVRDRYTKASRHLPVTLEWYQIWRT
jgi:hypothetical protein